MFRQPLQITIRIGERDFQWVIAVNGAIVFTFRRSAAWPSCNIKKAKLSIMQMDFNYWYT